MSTVIQEDWKSTICSELDKTEDMFGWECKDPENKIMFDESPDIFATEDRKLVCVFDGGLVYEYCLVRVEVADEQYR